MVTKSGRVDPSRYYYWYFSEICYLARGRFGIEKLDMGKKLDFRDAKN